MEKNFAALLAAARRRSESVAYAHHRWLDSTFIGPDVAPAIALLLPWWKFLFGAAVPFCHVLVQLSKLLDPNRQARQPC
jgi:hypothetical protein